MMATMGLTEIVGKLIIGVVADRIPVPKIFYMVAANCLGAGMLYAALKAALARKNLYKKAYLRPTQDIDILVIDEDKTRDIQALEMAGMHPHP